MSIRITMIGRHFGAGSVSKITIAKLTGHNKRAREDSDGGEGDDEGKKLPGFSSKRANTWE